MAHLCILSNSCNEPAYNKLIVALCKENSVPLIMVEDSKVLGEMVGLTKYTKDKAPRKTVGCSCSVIHKWGEESEAKAFILEHIKNGGSKV